MNALTYELVIDDGGQKTRQEFSTYKPALAAFRAAIDKRSVTLYRHSANGTIRILSDDDRVAI